MALQVPRIPRGSGELACQVALIIGYVINEPNKGIVRAVAVAQTETSGYETYVGGDLAWVLPPFLSRIVLIALSRIEVGLLAVSGLKPVHHFQFF